MWKPGLDMSDEKDLWNSFRSGSLLAYQHIYELYISELLLYGYRITSDRQLIRDSIQDLFLNLWESRENLSETTSIRFYLYRSLRNRIVRNSEKAGESVIYLTESLPAEDLVAPSPEDTLMEIEMQSDSNEKLQKALLSLTHRQKEVIQLRFFHHFSFEEISGMMNISYQSVRNLVHSAITKLRQQLLLFIFFLCLLLQAQQ